MSEHDAPVTHAKSERPHNAASLGLPVPRHRSEVALNRLDMCGPVCLPLRCIVTDIIP